MKENIIKVNIKNKPDSFKGNFNYLKDLYDSIDKACDERIKNDSNLVKSYDIESGFPTIITKEQQKRLIDLFESLRPNADLNICKGKIIFFGTGGSIEDNKSFEDMFYNPNNEEE